MTRVHTATNATVRDINRAVLLNLVRLEQPISRADLSRRTGMFRSNVSNIIDELVSEGMLTEKQYAPSGRGRRPTHLRLNDHAYPVLGVYIQPEATCLAYAGLSGTVQRQWTLATAPQPEVFVRQLSERIEGIASELGVKRFRKIALAFPGHVNSNSGHVIWSPTLPLFADCRLAGLVERHAQVPVVVDNDVNLGALSELRQIEADGQRWNTSFALLSIGDHGVGGGLVIRGELYHGHDAAFASEFGHLTVEPWGDPCTCGRRGCLERYVCNEALWRRYRPSEPFEKAKFSRFLAAANRGETAAIAALRETAFYLSIGLSNIAFTVNPGTVVIAGEITDAWTPLRDLIMDSFTSPLVQTEIRRARLQGESSLIHGAVCLALSDVFARPTLS